MRIVVFSDSHGKVDRLTFVVKRHREDAQLFLHCGDGLRELAQLRSAYPELDFVGVRGNCDLLPEPYQRTLDCQGIRLFFTHGHQYEVRWDLEKLKQAAAEQNASIALYGHTHKNFTGYEDGLYLMNPGSISQPRGGQKPSYGVIDLTPAGIVTNIVEVERFL